MKHTKGEWSYIPSEPNRFPLVNIGEHGRLVSNMSTDHDENEANAKLISAAPDMLKDIEAYVFRIDEWIEMLKNGTKNTEVINQLNDFKDFSKELITKATE